MPVAVTLNLLLENSKFPANSLTAVSGIDVILVHMSRRGRWFKSYIWVISRTQFSTDECKQYFFKTMIFMACFNLNGCLSPHFRRHPKLGARDMVPWAQMF